jgi:peptide/nickel transport system substrate-binding protein
LNEDLAPIPHDPEMAGQMLDEAGWPLGDDGVRVCEGCGTAEDGTPFAFDLIVYEGSVNAERIGLLMQDQLSEIGVEVELRILEFNTAIGEITGQTFDAALMSWSNSWPADPDVQQIFSASVDVVGSGFNMTSYNSPEMEALNDEANTLPGCDLAERAALYGQAQEILQADQPYLWLYTANDMYAARAEVEGFAPYPNSPFWNVETWEIAQP